MKLIIPTFDEYLNESLNEGADIKALRAEYGGYDDSSFLHIAWRNTPEELEALLKVSNDDLSWLKKHSKGFLGSINRKDAQWLKSRIDFIKQIIASKKKNGPDYITDFYK